jgi:hypothetical protein
MKILKVLAGLSLAGGLLIGQAQPGRADERPEVLQPRARLPLIMNSQVCLVTGQTYGSLSPTNPYGGDVSVHPDNQWC